MQRDEAETVIDLVISAYPKYATKKSEFDKPEIRINTLFNKLLERDFAKTMEKVDKYIDSSPYEPSMSDILPPKPYKPDKRWLEEDYD